MGVAIVQKTKKEILIEIKKDKLHGYEIAHRIGVSVTGIYQHLRDLKDEGLIESEKNGRKKIYFLTKKGEALLSILVE